MNNKISNKNIAIEMVEILKKYNVTYRESRDILMLVNRIIEKTVINSNSLNTSPKET